MKFYIEMQVEVDTDSPWGPECQEWIKKDISTTLEKYHFHYFYAVPLKTWILDIPEPTE